MNTRGFGRIVNIGSVDGQGGQYGQVNDAAAKSGIHGFTKALAQEGASKGITVNAIAPGYTETDMVTSGDEFGSPWFARFSKTAGEPSRRTC
jgi:acetoacetyl-CoA reductase